MIRPKRLYRTRKAHAFTPSGAIYVGRPTLWSNPFSGRSHIGHARSVILYGHWLAGDLSPKILRLCHFGEDEIDALDRWHRQLVRSFAHLRGRDLQCWCPPTSSWCHADTLLRIANGPSDQWPR